MSLMLFFNDNEYQLVGPIKEKRPVARGFVYDESGKVAFHFLKGDDIFGHREYYETPGGGVDEGETYEEAFIRECKEELGYQVKIVRYLGEVDDYYNLINRQNFNHYFLAKREGPYLGKHLVSEGDFMIAHTDYLTLDEALKAYDYWAKTPLARLVKQREYPLIKEAKKYLPLFREETKTIL